MRYIDKVCSFTGYRTAKLRECLSHSVLEESDLPRYLVKEITRLHGKGFSVFQCGMALGTDVMFAEAALQCKKDFPRIKLGAILPCRDQDKLWTDTQKARYQSLLQQADSVTYASQSYTKECMFVRNRMLVDSCELLIAVFDGQKGGTFSTIEYAKRKRKKIVILNPVTLKRTLLLHQSEEAEEINLFGEY